MPETLARIDPDQVRCMHATGVPQSLIARRLSCSERHVRRLLGGYGPIAPNPIIGTERERECWAYYRQMGESYRQIAYRFGTSRQRIFAALTNQ